MTSTTDMNIVLGQGNAIKEVHNVRKEHLELNQQFVAQQSEDKKKKERLRVQESGTENKIEIKEDDEKKDKEGSKNSQKNSKKGKKKKESILSGGSLIDIKV